MRKLLAILVAITLSSSCFAYVPVIHTNSHTHKGELILLDYYDSGYKTVRGKNLVNYDTISGIGIIANDGLNIFLGAKYVKCYADKIYTVSTVTATYRYNECGHYKERSNVIKDVREATAEEEHQLSMVENTPLFKVYDPIKDTYVTTFKSFMLDFCSIALVILVIAIVVLVIYMVIILIIS